MGSYQHSHKISSKSGNGNIVNNAAANFTLSNDQVVIFDEFIVHVNSHELFLFSTDESRVHVHNKFELDQNDSGQGHC